MATAWGFALSNNSDWARYATCHSTRLSASSDRFLFFQRQGADLLDSGAQAGDLITLSLRHLKPAGPLAFRRGWLAPIRSDRHRDAAFQRAYFNG